VRLFDEWSSCRQGIAGLLAVLIPEIDSDNYLHKGSLLDCLTTRLYKRGDNYLQGSTFDSLNSSPSIILAYFLVLCPCMLAY
jgi:hypothetical protein